MPKTITKVKVINKSSNPLPKYAKFGDSGMDVLANENIIIRPGERVKIKTGLFVEIPVGYEFQLRPKSGLSARCIDVQFGTIDSSYRGEICSIIQNNSYNELHIKPGIKIGQLVLIKLPFMEWEEVSELSQTERGDGGFGHTGI